MPSFQWRSPTIGVVRSVLLAIAFSATGISPLRAQPAVWTKYTSPDRKFSASFPGPATATTPTSENGIANVSYQSPVFQGCGYQIDVTTVSANLLRHRENFSDWFLRSAQQESIKAISASLRSNMNLRAGSDHQVELGSTPGREFISDSDRFTVIERIYVVGAPPQAFTNYALMVICPKGRTDSVAASNFLNSFRLLAAVEQPVSITREGWWAGAYAPSEIGDACGSGTLMMHVERLVATVELFPSGGDYTGIGKDFSFTAMMDSSSGSVAQRFLIPAGKFVGQFSPDYSTFLGTYSRGKCRFDVSLVRQQLESIPQKDLPPEVKQALPLVRQISHCLSLTDAERDRCLKAVAK
jgi:hypothetical protein